MPESPPDALEAVRDSVLQLVAQLPRLPSALRVVAGDITVEAEWPTAGGNGSGNGEVVVAVPAEANGSGGSGPVEPDPGHSLVRAPTVGAFFRAPKPGAPPFVEVGDQVVPGQQVAVVESMKLLFPVNAEVAGTVVEILLEDGAPVEHGEALLAISPG